MIEVADAREADHAAIVEIYNEAVVETVATFDITPLGPREAAAWLARFDAEHRLLVARVHQSVVGFAYYLPYRAKAAYARTKETSVYVARDRQRRGVGAALYGELIRRARAGGVHVLVAVVAGLNPGSEALHRSCGFERVGVLPEVGHKFGRWIDTTIWQRRLLP